MNNQEAFNMMVTHLRSQNELSKDMVGSCLYRGPDGMMCAIGCLIPDDMYMKSMEGLLFETLMTTFVDLQNHLGDCNECMLSEMQFIHDNIDIRLWESEFAKVAYDYHLTLPPLQKEQK